MVVGNIYAMLPLLLVNHVDDVMTSLGESVL